MTKDIKNKYFQIFPSVIIVKGKNIDAIYDLQRVKYFMVPKSFTYVVEELTKGHFQEIYSIIENKEVLESYISFLRDNELGVFSNEPLEFIPIRETMDYPLQLLCSIIDLDSNSNYPLDKLLSELNVLRCKFLEVRFYDKNLDKLYDILNKTRESTLHCIEIQYPFSKEMSNIDFITNLKKIYPRIMKFTFHSATDRRRDIIETKDISMIVTDEILKDESCCGVVSPWYYFPCTWMYIMSKNVNNCLWGKISVDRFGHIKNCPSLKTEYGDIRCSTLKEALEAPGFTDLWKITKDKILECKECERRYMCQDCRAYIQDPTNIYSKPSKCFYKP